MRDRNSAGGYLVRIETIDGVVRWRNVPDLTHRTLCSAGGFCDAITWFDVSSGFAPGGGVGSGGRKVDGEIFQGPPGSPPIGRITLVEEGEKFAEEDHREMIRRLGWRA